MYIHLLCLFSFAGPLQWWRAVGELLSSLNAEDPRTQVEVSCQFTAQRFDVRMCMIWCAIVSSFNTLWIRKFLCAVMNKKEHKSPLWAAPAIFTEDTAAKKKSSAYRSKIIPAAQLFGCVYIKTRTAIYQSLMSSKQDGVPTSPTSVCNVCRRHYLRNYCLGKDRKNCLQSERHRSTGWHFATSIPIAARLLSAAQIRPAFFVSELFLSR